MTRRLRYPGAVILLAAAAGSTLIPPRPSYDARLNKSFRRPERNGWIYVHLEGRPPEIGFQHGYWLAPEIDRTFRAAAALAEHDTKKPWPFYREAAEKILWPRIEPEYRDELDGIVEGVRARGLRLDRWDIVAHNAMMELPGYYVPWLEKQSGGGPRARRGPPESCSAFVATGRYTRDGRVVAGHNLWADYALGQHWKVIFDIVPAAGHRIFMDGIPGVIASNDDFGVNAAGLVITETTISRFFGFDPRGIPEFVRARKAMQYAASIDDFDRIMRRGNNGGYANAWLVADVKTGEIARLELGLKNVNLERTHDGYYVGANFPVSQKLEDEETSYDRWFPGVSGNARHLRWVRLMEAYRGLIDIRTAQKFLADHYDTFFQVVEPNQRTLCGHIDLSPDGLPGWQPPYGPAGTVQAKVIDAAMAERLSFAAAMGHPCGIDFRARDHLREHPEFSWQKDHLRDILSYPWTVFSAAAR